MCVSFELAYGLHFDHRLLSLAIEVARSLLGTAYARAVKSLSCIAHSLSSAGTASGQGTPSRRASRVRLPRRSS